MKNLAFIDIEATSSDHQKAEIIEIAALIKDPEGNITDHFHTLVKPAAKIPEEISTLTGITEAMVASSPEFNAFAEKLHDKLKNCAIVAHKAEFDSEILKRKFAELGLPFAPKTICTLELAKQTAPGMTSYSLASLCAFFGIRLKNNHRAMNDVDAAANLYEVLSLLNGKNTLNRKYFPKHEKMIRKASCDPGIVSFIGKNNQLVLTRPVDNIKKELEDRLELKPQNKSLLAKELRIQIQETGSLSAAMFIHAKEAFDPKWALYTYKNKRGQVIVRCGKVRKDKKALLYYKKKSLAVAALKQIVSSAAPKERMVYQEGPKLDKSEIAKRNMLIASEIKKLKPEINNILIRSAKALNGKYRYICVDENERVAFFENEEEIKTREEIQKKRVRFREIKPSERKALELSVQYIRNQRRKTDALYKLKRC